MLLDRDLLDLFERRVRQQGVPVDEWVNPGLAAETIRERLASIDLSLPVEGRVWWEWHDGSDYGGWDKVIGPGSGHLSLSDAIAKYRQKRQAAYKTADPDALPFGDPDYAWKPSWFPICGEPSYPIVIDCSVPEGAPTPIRLIDWQNVEGFFKLRARSLGEMVGWWIRAIDSGAWQWDAEGRRWTRHDELRDEEFRNNPVV